MTYRKKADIPRKYQPIWERIKADVTREGVWILVPLTQAATVRQAVKREKSLDVNMANKLGVYGPGKLRITQHAECPGQQKPSDDYCYLHFVLHFDFSQL